MRALDHAQLDALRAVRAACPNAQLCLIGAAALALHIPMSWRTTADLDLIVPLPLNELEAALAEATGFSKDPKQEQRWIAPNSVPLDLLPAPTDAMLRREFVWPRTGHAMGLGGVRLALAVAVETVASHLSLCIAPVPVLALLKMAAYLDRPFERDKDLQDLAHVLNKYPPAADDRFFVDAVQDRALDEDQARGWILGSELSALVNDEERELVYRFLDEVTGDEPKWARIVANSPWRHDEAQLRRRLEAFRMGFEAAA